MMRKAMASYGKIEIKEFLSSLYIVFLSCQERRIFLYTGISAPQKVFAWRS